MSNAVVLTLPRRDAPSGPPGADDSELRHELRTIVAGVAAAAGLLDGRQGALTGRQEKRLRRLMESELARLQRLLADGPGRIGVVDLDDVLDDAVLVHRARGLDVRWRRTGAWVLARADDLAQVLHVLLANTARHAPGSPVTVTVREHAGGVEVRVCDAGPGVPAELRRSLFTRGARGADSPGDGLGLSLARRLVADQGGSLELEPADGATFVVTLPAAYRSAS